MINYNNIPKQEERKDAYVKSEHIKFVTKGNKIIGVSTKPGESFRSFAYFKDSEEPARTSIYMEYRMRNRSVE